MFGSKRRHLFICTLALIAASAGMVRVHGQSVRTLESVRTPDMVTPPTPSIPTTLKFRTENGFVTAEIRAVPLAQVLEEVAARTGIVFEMGMHDHGPVSISLHRVNLQEAVSRIIGENNSIFYYGEGGGGEPQIRFVRVFSRANRPPQPSLRYIGTGKITKTGDDIVDTPEQALRVLAESSDVDARQSAVELLGTTGGEVAIEALTVALKDTVPEVKAAAMEALAGLGASAALPQILAALKDKHPGVRQSAILAVALLGDPSHVRFLRPLQRDPDASVASAAEMAIQKLAAPNP